MILNWAFLWKVGLNCIKYDQNEWGIEGEVFESLPIVWQNHFFICHASESWHPGKPLLDASFRWHDRDKLTGACRAGVYHIPSLIIQIWNRRLSWQWNMEVFD